MNNSLSLLKLIIVFVGLMLISACTPLSIQGSTSPSLDTLAESEPPQVWLEWPHDQGVYTLGDRPFEIQALIHDPSGENPINQVRLFVDGESIENPIVEWDDQPHIIYAAISWQPSKPGTYLIDVFAANDRIGQIGEAASVEITIVEQEMEIHFTADKDTVNYQECATLRWKVTNAEEVQLGDEPVDPEDNMSVCLDTTTEYQLTAISPYGTRMEETVTINVLPTPTAIPAATSTPTPTSTSTPTATTIPPTATAIPPTATAIPPTITPIPPTITPIPTATLPPILGFAANPEIINYGDCTSLVWVAEHVRQAFLNGGEFDREPLTGSAEGSNGEEKACPKITTTYELMIILPDGSENSLSDTVSVNPTPVPLPPGPPTNVQAFHSGGTTSVTWNASVGATYYRIDTRKCSLCGELCNNSWTDLPPYDVFGLLTSIDEENPSSCTGSRDTQVKGILLKGIRACNSSGCSTLVRIP